MEPVMHILRRGAALLAAVSAVALLVLGAGTVAAQASVVHAPQHGVHCPRGTVAEFVRTPRPHIACVPLRHHHGDQGQQGGNWNDNQGGNWDGNQHGQDCQPGTFSFVFPHGSTLIELTGAPLHNGELVDLQGVVYTAQDVVGSHFSLERDSILLENHDPFVTRGQAATQCADFGHGPWNSV